MEKKREYVLHSLHRYWPRNQEQILDLPMPKADIASHAVFPPKFIEVALPEWASDVSVNGSLLIPRTTSTHSKTYSWDNTDWIAAAFWYLNGSAERAFERKHGPIHSNCFRLKNWDPRMWERAWVNRIALFLRRWAAYLKNCSEDEVFGSLSSPEIILTHDVDAVEKTLILRTKQFLFHLINLSRNIINGNWNQASFKAVDALRFFFSRADYWCFDEIMELEKRFGVRSHFNFYGGQGGWSRTPKELLFDPSYNIMSPRLREIIQILEKGGWKVGLHPSFNTWGNLEKLRKEKKLLENVLRKSVGNCRQHWLKFSWEKTWQTQEDAGFKLDTTLGFNDRPGFRVGSAIEYFPWHAQEQKPMDIAVIPMVLMDSHFYDYGNMSLEQCFNSLEYWLKEINEVRGTATIIWHQRVMSPDYGWGSGYRHILSYLNK